MATEGVNRVSADRAQSRRRKSVARESTVLARLARASVTQVALEFEITWRMLADNVLASFTPGFVLVTAISLRQRLRLMQILVLLGKASILSSLYTYIFDAINQARGIDEDRINKPYRPIPAGLLTPAGAAQRFWIAMAIYTIIGWRFSVLEYVLIWQAATIIINIWCSPRHYFWCKTLCMALGVGSQLAQAWKLVAPIDETGKRWVVFMAVAYPPPLIFEDIRDMAGDKNIGRRTLALLLGELPVRIWFATIMASMPILAHTFLFKAEARATWRLVLCDILVTTICWTTVVRSLLLRSVKADRITYQLFIFSYIVVLCCGCILWA